MYRKRKIRVGIIFGGKSTEHEVSLQSAKNVVGALDREKYEPVLIGIDKKGTWYRSSGAQYLLHNENSKLIALNKRVAQEVGLVTGERRELMVLESSEKQLLDVVFPVLHGPLGEDGTVQGLLKLLGIPFVGSSVLGSAIGMDKDVQKRLLREAGIPIARFLVWRRDDRGGNSPFVKGEEANTWSFRKAGARRREAGPKDFSAEKYFWAHRLGQEGFSFSQIKRELGPPFFVKPANAGSSVGVHKVKKEADFAPAVTDAFKYDSKILIEEAIEGREIECAVLGNEAPIASVPGEIKPNHEFYSYEAKYIDEHGAVCEIPAKLPSKIVKKVQETALAAFNVLECEGMARVDMFLAKDGRVLVNEINTIPGFTKISMYPKLFAASGIPYPKLIDRLIELAFLRAKRVKKLQTNFKL